MPEQKEPMDLEKMEKDLEQAHQQIVLYEMRDLISNQTKFNEWTMTQILSLKEGINQIGLILSDMIEQVEPEVKEEVKQTPVPEPVVKAPAKKGWMSKLGKSAKTVADSVE